MNIAQLNATIKARQTQGQATRCHRCGRGFSDCGEGNATRVSKEKYRDTTSDCGNYCTACFYQYNCGFKGRDYGY